MATNPVKSRDSRFPITGNQWELGNLEDNMKHFLEEEEECESENE